MVAGTPYSKHSRLHFRPPIVSSVVAFLFVTYLVIVVLCPKVPVLVTPVTSHPEAAKDSLSSRLRAKFSGPVQKLLTDLKDATRLAQNGGLPFSYTADRKERWNVEHPCRGRLELPLLFARKHVNNVGQNHQWEAVVEAYSDLHRTCIGKIANLTDYFLQESTVPGCKFVTGESLFGLGNKITYAASVVLYAILTQRVVLFYEWSTSVPAVMCEPFEGSSWKLPHSLQYLNKRKLSPTNVNRIQVTNATERFLAWVDREKLDNGLNHHDAVNDGRKKIYHTDVDDGWQPVDRFFCASEQEFLSQIRWISMAGCLYFLPKLFAVTSFRPTLEALFPDRIALTHVLRSVFVPNDVAWDRIRRTDDMFLSRADKRVSIQVRYRYGAYEHAQLHDSVNSHIIRCLLENELLPNISMSFSSLHEEKYGPPGSPSPTTTKVLITSLQTDLHDVIQEMYLRHPTVTGESVGFVQLTHDEDQHWGLESDTQALVEIILLSLSDQMLVTPLSTFGGVAQAYGGVKPWVVEHINGDGSCVRASSMDICYQDATESFSCPHDLDVHKKLIYDHIPYIQRCLDVDSPTGLLVITT